MSRIAGVLLGLGLSMLAGAARAEPLAEGLAEAVTALEGGKQDEAIATLEALADRGFAHPDVAFTRGLAYAQRARGKGALPGVPDLATRLGKPDAELVNNILNGFQTPGSPMARAR